MAKAGGHGRLLDDPLIVGNNRNPIYGLQIEPISTLRNAVHFCQGIVPELKDINLLMAVDQAIEAMTIVKSMNRICLHMARSLQELTAMQNITACTRNGYKIVCPIIYFYELSPVVFSNI